MNKTILIIVCGGTGSGKTTIASEIKKILPKKFKTQIVSMDSFYKKREYMDQDIYFKHNFDHPNAFDWPLMLVSIQSMLEHKPTMIPIYDYSKSERTNKTELIPASDVIIFEGILSLYDQKINKLASIKIFVDTPDDERFIRRLLRDKKERGRSDDNIIGQWRNTVRVMHRLYVRPLRAEADLVIPWYKMNQTAIDAIKGGIESIVKKGNKK